MEACLAVEKEHHKVNQKLQSASQTISNKLGETISAAQSLKSSLTDGKCQVKIILIFKYLFFR